MAVADSLDVAVTGSGTIGDVTPGWSVQEFATPVNPAESAGGTGTVSFSTSAREESLLLVSGDSVASNGLGSISGKITSVSESGLGASFTQDTKLSRFDVDRVIPAIQAASVPAALDLVDQLTGTVRLNQATGSFFSMAGHCSGFDADGNLVDFMQQSVPYQYYDATTGTFKKATAQFYQNAVWASQFSYLDGQQYARDPKGDSFQIIDKYTGYFWNTSKNSYTKNRVAMKLMLNGADAVFTFNGGPVDNNLGTGQTVTVTVDYVNQNLIVRSDYRSGGTPTTSSETVPMTGLNRSAELALFIEFTYDETNGSPLANGYYVRATLVNTSDYSTKVHASIFYGPDGMDLWFDAFEVTGRVRSIWRDEVYFGTSWDSTFAPFEWESPAQFTISGAPIMGKPVAGFEGNCWQYLQLACASYHWEIGLISDTITAQPVGGTSIDVTEYVGSPSITPSISQSARQVDVNYTGATVVYNQEVYSAREDSNQILSVGAAQTTVTTVATTAFLQSVRKPTRVTTFVPGAGTYYVIDSTGLPIVAEQWEDYGGDVSVDLDQTARGGIIVTLTGPYMEIPSTTAPYSLAVSDGENQYAALSILGTGIVTEPGLVELLTGADPTKVKQLVGTTITSPFVADAEMAYDTGIRASVEYGGPRVGLSMEVGIKHVSGFGLTPGALIRWRNSQYRVLSSTINTISATLELVKHVTVGDFDAIYVNQNVAEHDTVWSGYTCSDQDIFPFKQPIADPNSLGFGMDPFGETGFGSALA